jgi:hypothetical protein
MPSCTHRISSLVGITIFLCGISATGCCNDFTASITLNSHKFTPSEIHVKANTPTTVTLTNNDVEAEEFDSTSLKIEKIVAGHSTGTMRWRPLAPGRYPFMGEFHSTTAQGVVIAE